MGLLDNFAKNKANPVVWNILSPFLNGDIVGTPIFGQTKLNIVG